MGDITLISATYLLDNQPQSINLLNEMNEELAKNYGELDIVVSTLDAKLRKNDRIPKTTAPGGTLSITYADKEGAWHIKEADLNGTIKIGERSVFGKMVQKPGQILWSSSLVIGQWMMVFVVVTGWALVVLWSWMQTRGMEGKFKDWSTITMDRFGPIGFVIAVLIYMLFYIVRIPCEFFGKMASSDPPDGWILKMLMAAASGYAPIPGFLVQTIIWMTVVRNLGKPAGETIVGNLGAATALLPARVKAAAAAKGLNV